MLPEPPLGPSSSFDPDQKVKVLPRHLAGPGERDLREIWPFPIDSGWHFHPAEEGMAFSSSPCARVWTRLVLEPDTRDQGTWTIGASRTPFGPTSWEIVFDVTTPAEILHDVHAELRDCYLWDRSSDRAYLFNDETPPHTAYAPLFASGWSHEASVQGTQTFRSPDGLGAVRHRFASGAFRGPDDPAWTAWAGDWGTPQWKARFARRTPATLVAAFTTSLISTEPLHRTLKDVPLDFRHRLNTAAATARQPPARPPAPAGPPPTGPAPRRTQYHPQPHRQGVPSPVHARLVPPAAVAISVAVALAWAPAASAQPSEPTSRASAETPAPDAGSVEITTKDTAGDVLAGAALVLLDASGREAGRGTTDVQGMVTWPDLVPGIYRLKETSSGSPLHELVADQDVIVTPGATTRLTVTSPFKPAKLFMQVKDDKSDKLLPGATVNIGTGTSTLLTLTTGSQGSASGDLPVSSRATRFWAKEIKAPAGYDLYKPTKTFTAGPAARVTVTVANAQTATAPKPDPSDEPTHTPTPTQSTPGKPSSGTGGTAPSASSTSTPAADASTTAAEVPVYGPTSKAPTGSLAHTGADATPWIATGAGLLVAAGAAVLIAARRRTVDVTVPDSHGRNS